jgi:hypothetical protein
MSQASTIAEFFINENSLINFQRCNPNTMDCTINVFEILQVFNNQDSAMLRDNVRGVGMFDHEFLVYLQDKARQIGRNFIFFSEPIAPEQIINYAKFYLRSNHAIIIRHKIPTRHVFIIAKDQHNKTYIIDPQVSNQLCDLDMQICINHILDPARGEWEIIRTQPYLPPVLDMSDIDMDVSFAFSSNKKYRKGSRKNSRNHKKSRKKSRKNSKKSSRKTYAFGVFGSLKQKALSAGKSAVEQVKKYGSGVASDLKSEAQTQATALKQQAQQQATVLKQQGKDYATQQIQKL